MKKLTIGSTTYDDFEGIFFTYQSLRLNNLDILPELDLLVVDNNPSSPEGKATKDFCLKSQHIRYIPYTKTKSTGVKNKVFESAEAPYTLYMDGHVLLEPQTIKNLIAFFQANPQNKDLYHGPLFMDCLEGHDPMTHMDPIWRGHMWGTWAVDPRGTKPHMPPFEIPMQGMGLVACKTDEWLGFNKNFIGFGGEEGYIHEKYRLKKRTVWCLPFLRWLHRFGRPRGVPYPLDLQHRIHNYFLGFKELGLDPSPIINHFQKESPDVDIDYIQNNLEGVRDKFLITQGLKKNSRPAPSLPKLMPSVNEQNIVLELPE
jgi:hypothetical protein